MSADKNIQESGRRLGRDMQAIREERGISHEAISRTTKAAKNILEEFEETALVGNPMYNRVYLRLFMRGYAEIVGIRTDDVLRAADEMLAGTYTDRLRRLYLDEEPEPPPAELPTPSASVESPAAPGERASSTVTPPKSGAGTPSAGKETDGTTAADKSAAGASSGPGDAKPGTSATSGSAAKAGTASGPASKAGAASGPTSRVGGSTRAAHPTTSGTIVGAGSSPRVILPAAQSLMPWLGGAAAVVIIALAAWFLWPDAAPQAPAPAELLPPDTLQTAAPVLPPRIVLGDTTSFYVIAARDTLNPIRLTVDNGLRTPYWIEFLDSLELRVTDQLVVEQRLNAVDVSVADILVPTDQRDPSNRLVLTKSGVQAFLDSLRTSGGYPLPPVGAND